MNNTSTNRTHRFLLTVLLAGFGLWLGGLPGQLICVVTLVSRLLGEGLAPRFGDDPVPENDGPKVYVIDSRSLMMGAA